jgi:hypothetical protein
MGAAAFLDRLGALAPRSATSVAFALWAAAEAVFLPVVPDVGLCLVVLAAPRHAVRLFAAVVAGALAGTLLLAILVDRAPAAAESMLLALPGIDAAVLRDADDRLAGTGVVGFAQIGIGPPLKVLSNAWLGRGGDAAGLAVGSILNRLTRVGLPLLVAAIAGAGFGPWFRRHAGMTLLAYAVFWIAVYAWIWT